MTPFALRPAKLIAIVLLVGAAVLAGSQVLPGLGLRTTGATPDANVVDAATTSDAFERAWARTDRPVADGMVNRTWMWGPAAFTDTVFEEYAGAPGGERAVIYFEKARMEITDPEGDQRSAWFVTNGLLARELITGLIQLGDNAYDTRPPARINVAGDLDDPDAPTYQTFADRLDDPPYLDGSTIVTRLDRAGNTIDDPSLAAHGVIAAHRVQETGIDHQVAAPFWTFMHSSGTVYEDGAFTTAPLFENPYYATGYPITEAYWTTVSLGGTPRDVLVQCFERRCLTYTPSNPDGWKVEAGNVGQHYYTWRHSPAPTATEILYESTLLDWDTGEHPFGATFVQGDAYHVRVETPGGAIDRTTPSPEYGNAQVSLDVRLITGTRDVAGCLVFRLNFDSFNYALCINGQGETYALYDGYNHRGEPVTETLLEAQVRVGTGESTDWNTLSVAGQGDQLWFFLNDEPIGSATHAGSTSGYAGLKVVNGGDSPAEVAFRNLSIRAVDPSLMQAN